MTVSPHASVGGRGIERSWRMVFCLGVILTTSISLVRNGAAQNVAARNMVTHNARRQPSDHFDGERFHNLDPGGDKGFSDLLRWQTTRLFGTRRVWSKYKEYPSGAVPLARVDNGRLRVTWVGHATVLIQMDGVNILTDPVWSQRVSPVSFVGPKRVRPPGIRFEDLPPIDLVLVSHDHYDHLDVPTLRRLAQKHQPRIAVGLRLDRLLESKKIKGGAEMDWWQTIDLPNGVRVTSVPARHWSGRGVRGRNKTLWCGYVVEGKSGTIYFAGDTGYGMHFAQIAERFPSLRLALLPIGAHLPRWFMQANHMSPEDAVRAHQLLRPKMSIGIHFGTFPLADEGERQPIAELTEALSGSDDPDLDFDVLAFGEGVDVP